MRNIIGIKNLLENKLSLPKTGWIFTDNNVDSENPDILKIAVFYIPENEDDEFDGEDTLSTLVETPIFLAICANREKNLESPTDQQYIEALIHYLKYDDFIE